MMKLVVALFLMVMLVGCASYSWVSVSDNGNYDFYQNGKLVCESASSCRIGASLGKEMLLEIRKDDIVYAHLLVLSKDKKRAEVNNDTERFVGGVVSDYWSGRPHSRGDVMLLTMAGGAAATGYMIAKPISMIILDNITQLPSNMTIPVGVSDSVGATFSWDQPATD